MSVTLHVSCIADMLSCSPCKASCKRITTVSTARRTGDELYIPNNSDYQLLHALSAVLLFIAQYNKNNLVKLCRRKFHSVPPFILIVFHDICFVMQIFIPRNFLMDYTASLSPRITTPDIILIELPVGCALRRNIVHLVCQTPTDLDPDRRWPSVKLNFCCASSGVLLFLWARCDPQVWVAGRRGVTLSNIQVFALVLYNYRWSSCSPLL